MKLQANREQLLQIVTPIVRSTPSRSVMASYQMVLLEASDENLLKITGGSVEHQITAEFRATVAEPGVVALPARPFQELLSNLTGAVVLIAESNESREVSIESGRALSVLRKADPNEYYRRPDAPDPDGNNSCQLEAKAFGVALDRLLFAAANIRPDEDNFTNRAILNGVNFITKDNHLHLATCNGIRLSLHRVPFVSDHRPEWNITVPAEALTDLRRLTANGTATLICGDQQATCTFRIDAEDGTRVEMKSSLLSGKYPDYTGLIPTEFESIIEIDDRDFRELLAATSPFIHTDTPVTGLETVSANGANSETMLKVQCYDPELGSVVNEIPVMEMQGNMRPISLNSHYLKDAAARMSWNGKLRISVPATNGPIRFNNPDDANYLHLIVPIITKLAPAPAEATNGD